MDIGDFMNEFYLVDEKHKSIKGNIVELKGLLYFKHSRAGYDGKANKDHIKQYPGEFENFMKANPDYVLPDSLKDVEIGAPVFEAQIPVVVE